MKFNPETESRPESGWSESVGESNIRKQYSVPNDPILWGDQTFSEEEENDQPSPEVNQDDVERKEATPANRNGEECGKKERQPAIDDEEEGEQWTTPPTEAVRKSTRQRRSPSRFGSWLK